MCILCKLLSFVYSTLKTILAIHRVTSVTGMFELCSASTSFTILNYIVQTCSHFGFDTFQWCVSPPSQICMYFTSNAVDGKHLGESRLIRGVLLARVLLFKSTNHYKQYFNFRFTVAVQFLNSSYYRFYISFRLNEKYVIKIS